MKKTLLFLFTIFFLSASSLFAQVDSIRPVEPNMETSYDNQELLIIALVGLVVLIALYFFFKKSRRLR